VFEPYTPINDQEIKNILVVTAHPDDLDFGCSGTIALWRAAGIAVSYLICTNGDQGGEDPSISREDMAKIRQGEQRDAAKVVGVDNVTFLNYRDGWLEPTIALRKDIVRQIRIHKPDRMVIQSPDRNWDRLFASHPDHMAAGEAAIQAVYPDARNQFAFEDLLKEEKLEPHRIREVWVMAAPQSNHFVDITETMDLKIKALKAHASQTGHNPKMEEMVRSWGEKNGEAMGLTKGSYAEIFRVVNTD
jgi:LmbE family N-acetylglucosaminyl deacetylase